MDRQPDIYRKRVESLREMIDYIQNFISMGTFSAFRHPTSYLEIAIIAFIIYHILVWIKNTRAWTLFKGIVVVLVFALLAELLHLTTILWIFGKTFNVVAIAVIVIFQPELRKALEELGRKRFVASLFSTGETEQKGQANSDKCINEVVRAAYEMGKVKTGALIVLEREVLLSEYERTGIPLDSVVSNQLLINILSTIHRCTMVPYLSGATVLWRRHAIFRFQIIWSLVKNLVQGTGQLSVSVKFQTV